MTEEQDSPQWEPLKATLKAGGGYEAPWITVTATDPGQLTTRVRALANGGAIEAVAEVAELFRAAHIVAAGVPASQVTPTTPAPAAATTTQEAPPPQSQVKTCAHGVRVFKSGGGGNTGKKPWQAWMCALPRGSAGTCDPEWA